MQKTLHRQKNYAKDTFSAKFSEKPIANRVERQLL